MIDKNETFKGTWPFPVETKESIIGVHILKEGKIVKTITEATPI